MSKKQVGDHSNNLDYDGTNALYLPTATEASSESYIRSKYDETVDADPDLPPVWSADTLAARVTVVIAGDITPTVVSVSCPLTPGGDIAYGVGDEIDLEVEFTTRIFVKDSVSLPYLLVETGEERRGEAQVRQTEAGSRGGELATLDCLSVLDNRWLGLEVFLELNRGCEKR